jgi:hypothetical protein
MSRKNRDPEHLQTLSTSELDHELGMATDRVETRASRCLHEGRDLTPREIELNTDDRDECAAIMAEIETRSRYRERVREVGEAVEQITAAQSAAVETRSAPFRPTLLVSDANLERHAEAMREGRPYGAMEIETRARVTAAGDLGSAGAWDPGQPNEPRHLIAFAGIPISPLIGRTAQVPKYTGPSGAAGVDESTPHGEYDSVDPVNLTGVRYGRWTQVSALANVVDDLRGVNMMHAWGIARDLDLLAVQAIQTAASTPAVLTSLEAQVRQATLQVAAATYSDESQLVIFGTPADLSLLTGTTPANADDKGSVPVRYNGAKLYPSLSATADQVTVFAPNAFRVFQTPLQSGSQIDPTDGSNKFGQWLHSTGVAQQITGSAAAVATAE